MFDFMLPVLYVCLF